MEGLGVYVLSDDDDEEEEAAADDDTLPGLHCATLEARFGPGRRATT